MEGKKKYFALVIFLFLGLMVFTFANPAEEDTEFTDGGTNTSETTKKNDKTTTTEDTEEGMDTETILNNVTNTNTNTNNTTTVTDTSLADAIAAVEKAEGTYTQEDVDAAKELVNNVTDTTEKGELENRLAEVEAGIAVDALLAELENKVEEAANKDDMNTATDYRDENEIADKIAALTNETVQEALYARLDEVSKLLDDNAAPVITGVEDGKAYAENTTITIEDAAGNAYIVTMLKDGEEVNIYDGYTTTGEGVYTLTVVDEAFNEATVTFTVDMTDPTFAEITNGGHYDEVTVNVEDLTDVTITVTNMDTNETTTVENGTILTEEATYKLVATDAAGNKTTYYVAIDKTKPAISTTNGSIINYTKWTEVTDKFLTTVVITHEAPDGTITTEEFTRADFEVGARNENFKFRYKLEAEGKYTITAEDKYGNTKTETVTIDKTAAKLVSANMYSNGNKYIEDKNTVYYTTNGNVVTAYIRVNEQLKDVPVFTFELGETVYVTTDVTESFHNADDEANGIYRYQTTMLVDEFDPEIDGDVIITVSDIMDRAGNTTDDVTSVTNKNIVRIDRTEARISFSTVNPSAERLYTENKVKYYYVKNGDTVSVRVGFKEELLENPTVTIGGRNVEMTFQKYFESTQEYVYIGTFTIADDETELVEGSLDITISNIVDKAGNKGFYYLSNGKTVMENYTSTKTSNQKTLVYDRTAATRKSADFYVSGLTQVEKTFYTQYGKTLIVNITTDEELKEVPTFTLHNNGNDYVIEGAIYRGLNDKGYHLYQASYEITEETGMTDGEITFTVSNIIDRAGNITTDVTEATNGRKVVLDNEGPVADKLAIRGVNGEWNKDKTVYTQYAKEGTTIYVDAHFKEELATTPVITLNNSVELTVASKKQTGNVWIYSYSYKVGADDLEEGEVQVTATNCKDYAGNETVLTNENMTLTSQKTVIIDRTAPVYSIYKDGQRPVENVEVTEYNGKLYFNTDAEIQFHDNYRLATISLNDGSAYTTTVGVTGQIKYVREDGEYKYVVTDRAGNQTTLTVVRDTVSPEVTEHSYVGENPYSGMSFKLYDNSAVDKFILNDKEFDRTNNQWSDANYENIKSALINGENTLVLYDIAGNTTTHTFTLDRVAPTITVKESSVGINNLYSQLDLKLYDANGVASVVINGTQLSHTGTWVDINDGHAYTFQNGENVVVVTDTAGNVTTQTFNTTKFNLVVENGIANLTEDVTLIDSSFYNKIDEENEVTINGNGKTVTQYITSVDKMQWTHNNTYSSGYYVPVLANVFSSLNGAKVTVNNVKFKGTVNTIMLGNYETTTSNWFNTELNNVDVVGLEVVSFSANISPAVVVYGNATLNNTNIYGTTRSSLENAADDPYWPIYDLAVVNFSKTSINGGKIGTIYTWAKARLEINNAEVDTITSAIRKTTDFQDGELLIGSGTKVNKIIVTNAKAVITIKAGATVDTIDFNGLDQSEMTIVIEDGATVNNQVA